MTSNLKIPSPWAQLALLLILAGSALVLAGVSVLIIPGVHAGQIPSDPGTLKLVQTISSVVLFGVPALFYALMTFRQEPIRELGFRPTEKSIFYLVPVILLLVSI